MLQAALIRLSLPCAYQVMMQMQFWTPSSQHALMTVIFQWLKWRLRCKSVKSETTLAMACTCPQVGSLNKHVKFGPNGTMYSQVRTTPCYMVSSALP